MIIFQHFNQKILVFGYKFRIIVSKCFYVSILSKDNEKNCKLTLQINLIHLIKYSPDIIRVPIGILSFTEWSKVGIFINSFLIFSGKGAFSIIRSEERRVGK